MRQIAIKLETWAEDRFTTLLELSGWNAPMALGVLTMLWAKTRQGKTGPTLTTDELRCAVSHAGPNTDETFAFLVLAGYVQLVEPGTYRIVDNDRHFALNQKLREAGARGGYQRHRSRAPKKLSVAKNKTAVSETANVWRDYSEAYRERYGVAPVRNATVNGQLSRLVSLVGADAPQLAAFYVRHDGAFYVRCQHSVGPLLKDYSGLYTQFQRGVTVTEHDVSAHSQSSALETQLRRFGCR